MDGSGEQAVWVLGGSPLSEVEAPSLNKAERAPIGLRVYVLSVAFVALGFGLIFWLKGSPLRPLEALFFWTLYAFAHWPPVEMPVAGPRSAGATKGRPPTLSAGFLVLMTVAFASTPATAALVGLLSPIAPHNWRGGLRTTFNGAQGALYTGAAAMVFHGIKSSEQGLGLLAALAAAALAALVAISLNTALVAGAMSLERKWSFGKSWRALAWPAPHSLAFALAALLVATLYANSGFLAAIFLVTPLVVLRHIRRGRSLIDEAQENTLRAFVRAVELKDPYTSRHSERVASIAVEIHRYTGASDEALRLRFFGALLHDIGKIAVPGRILVKPARLTEEEYESVKRHPVVGAGVTDDVEFLACLRDEILFHHERLDGLGYPFGLEGEAIPMSARILAVADTFEALTSDRPYRAALTFSEALMEMRRNVGSQLDPGVFSVLEELLGKGQVFPVLGTGADDRSAQVVGSPGAKQA